MKKTKITIFSKKNCRNCQLAKKLIGKVAEYDEIDVDNGFEEMAIYSNHANTNQMPLIEIIQPSPEDTAKTDMSSIYIYEGVYKIKEAVAKIEELKEK